MPPKTSKSAKATKATTAVSAGKTATIATSATTRTSTGGTRKLLQSVPAAMRAPLVARLRVVVDDDDDEDFNNKPKNNNHDEDDEASFLKTTMSASSSSTSTEAALPLQLEGYNVVIDAKDLFAQEASLNTAMSSNEKNESHKLSAMGWHANVGGNRIPLRHTDGQVRPANAVVTVNVAVSHRPKELIEAEHALAENAVVNAAASIATASNLMDEN